MAVAASMSTVSTMTRVAIVRGHGRKGQGQKDKEQHGQPVEDALDDDGGQAGGDGDVFACA